MLSQRSQSKKEIHTVVFHLYINIKNTNESIVTKNRSIVNLEQERIMRHKLLGGDGYVYYINSDGFRRRQWHPTPVLFPGKSHGWKRLVGCSPWGR